MKQTSVKLERKTRQCLNSPLGLPTFCRPVPLLLVLFFTGEPESKLGSLIFFFFFTISDESQRARFEATLWSNRISESLGFAVVFTPSALLKKHEFEGAPSERMDQGSSKESQWLDDLMAHCLPLLKCNAHALQFAAYHLLSK